MTRTITATAWYDHLPAYAPPILAAIYPAPDSYDSGALEAIGALVEEYLLREELVGLGNVTVAIAYSDHALPPYRAVADPDPAGWSATIKVWGLAGRLA